MIEEDRLNKEKAKNKNSEDLKIFWRKNKRNDVGRKRIFEKLRR